MNLHQRIENEFIYISHSISTMESMLSLIDDKYMPMAQKILRLEKLKSKCLETSDRFKLLFSPLKDEASRKEVKNILKGFEVVYNHTQSIIDMASDNDLQKEEYDTFFEKQRNRFSKLKTLISCMSKTKTPALEKAIYKKSGVVAAESVASIDDVISSSVNDEGSDASNSGDTNMKLLASSSDFPEIEKVLRNFGPYFLKNEKFRKDIPTSSNLPAVLRKMPVIPTFVGHGPSAEDFSIAGFDADKIGERYVILNNQIVAGVNINIVTDLKAKKRGSKADEDKIPFVVSLHEQLEDSLGVQLERVGGSIGTPGFQWFWFVRSSLINRLNSHGKRMAVKEWSFALQRWSKEELDRIHSMEPSKRDLMLTRRGLSVPVSEKVTDVNDVGSD